MRSFSFLPVLATLAFSVFTSAAPSPLPSAAVVAAADVKAVVAAGPGHHARELERRCVPCEYWQTCFDKIGVEVQAIVALDVDVSVTADLKVHLTNIVNIITEVIAYVKVNVDVFVGLAVADVISLLVTLLGLISQVVVCVLAIVKVLVAADVKVILALLDQLLCLVGDLVCIILAVVGGLLGDVLTIVAEILVGTVITALGAISGCFSLFPDLAAHWPQPCGGSIAISGLVNVVIGLVGNIFVALGIKITL